MHLIEILSSFSISLSYKSNAFYLYGYIWNFPIFLVITVTILKAQWAVLTFNFCLFQFFNKQTYNNPSLFEILLQYLCISFIELLLLLFIIVFNSTYIWKYRREQLKPVIQIKSIAAKMQTFSNFYISPHILWFPKILSIMF